MSFNWKRQSGEVVELPDSALELDATGREALALARANRLARVATLTAKCEAGTATAGEVRELVAVVVRHLVP